MKWIFIVILTCGLLARAASIQASVTRDSPLNGSPTAEFASVGLFGNAAGFYGSGVAILNGYWVLTARHNVTVDGTITGNLQAPEQLRFKTDLATYTAESLFANFDADLALLKLTAPVASFSDLWTASHGDEVNQIFTAVGYGGTDADGDEQWGPGGFGTKRLFENQVDSVQPGSLIGQGVVLRYDFDKTSVDSPGGLEGLAGPGDSGGGVFLPYNSTYLLAGIMSSSGSPLNGSAGSIVRIADYSNQILTVIPEPQMLLAAVLIFPLLRRRAP